MNEQKKESMKKFGVPAIAVIAAAIAAAPSAHADTVLAQYNFNDGTHGGTTTAATSDANDASTVAGLGVSDITSSPTGNTFSYNDSAGGTLLTNGSDDGLTWYTKASLVSQGANANDYIEFTLTPDAGYSLTLGNLSASLGLSRDSSAASGANPWSFAVYTSSDGIDFGTSVGTLSSSTSTLGGSSSPTTGPVWTDPSVDLSSLGTITGPITIRLVFSKDSATTQAKKYMMVDTVSLSGSLNATVIPEPAAASMGLLALAGMATVRRRRA